MGIKSKIEWTDATFNPWRGCQRVSPGCQNCYAEAMSKRNPKVLGEWGPKGTRIVASESYWKQPYKWNRQAEKEGVMKRVFCASLADVFEDHPGVIQARMRLWDVIHDTPNLNWLLLTKRPENFDKFLPWVYGPRIWLGVTVENQEMADKRIPLLIDTPAAVRFLSVEPMLCRINLSRSMPFIVRRGEKIHWCIVGGESGHHARPMMDYWVRDLMHQCNDSGIPFFMKQGSQANWTNFKNFDSFPEDLQVREYPFATHVQPDA